MIQIFFKEDFNYQKNSIIIFYLKILFFLLIQFLNKNFILIILLLHSFIINYNYLFLSDYIGLNKFTFLRIILY